jgi:pimeloyl-ACP methyl ester carboxylesterase
MINPAQVATVVIGAMLSAGVFYGGLDHAAAGPVAVSGEAAIAAPKTSPAAPAVGGLRNTPATFTETPGSLAPPPAIEPHARAYLFRGALGPIFSRGMDRLTERIEQAGITANVYEFTICRLIAATAIREYRQDPAPIILIGHSMGGFCALKFAEILQAESIPVSLVVTVDPAHVTPSVPLNVERYINIFLSNSVLGGGDVVPRQGYQGHYASFDLSQHDEVSHINIDKMDSIHEQLVAKIVELATAPVKAEGETVALRYVVPPDAAIELWDSGTPVFARRGDTLQTIAALHHVPLWALAQINQASDTAPLALGDRLIVPREIAPPAPVSRPPLSRR